MYLIDSHCHLDILDYNHLHKDVYDVLAKAAHRDVKFFLSVATTISNYFAARKIVGVHNNVVFSCGVHPLNCSESYDLDDLRRLAADPNVVAVGETGLDYYHTSESLIQQQESFRNHIRVGRELKNPVIVHARNSYSDILKILQEEKAMDCGGVLHSFVEEKEIARKLLDLGFYISFSGIITFRNADRLRNVVQYIPLDRILLETDSPYLAPVPHRGKENQPAMIRDIAECIAILKGVSIDEIARVTTENFVKLFQIDIF